MNRKWIFRAVAFLVVIFMAVLVVVALSLDSIVKKGVETVGPQATQVDVKLRSAGVSVLSGRVELMGFWLGNPSGCKTPAAITADNVSVQVKPGSVFSDKLVVENISLKEPVITLEGGLRDNNLTKIQKNLNDYLGGGSTAQKASGPAKSERKLQVDELLIKGAKVQVNTALSGGRMITLTIPDIHLTGLGSGPDGITGVEVGQRTLNALLEAATTAIAKNLSGLGINGANSAKGAAQKAADTVKGLFH